MSKRIDENGRVFKKQNLRCGNCDRIFDSEMELNIPVEEFVALMRSVTCPYCSSNHLFMGQSRSLAEDKESWTEGTIEERVDHWLEHGETGLSSQAIVNHMLGRPSKDTFDAPRDSADLRRCVLLLQRIPEWANRISEMSIYRDWKKIGQHWDEVLETFISEVGTELERKPAPQTSKLIDSLTV